MRVELSRWNPAELKSKVTFKRYNPFEYKKITEDKGIAYHVVNRQSTYTSK